MTHSIWQSRRALRTGFALGTALAFVPLGAAIAQQAAPMVPVPTVAAAPIVPGTPAPQAPAMPGAPALAGAQAVAQPGKPGGMPAVAAAGAPAVKSASPEEANPFSNVKTTDDKSVKQELPVLEQRLKSMEDKMSAIQQVQAVLPADALSAPGAGRSHAPGAPGADEDSMALETATFVACVNGKALFRDTDQKPFFVNAKDANQNEAVRRIGGCKH